MKYAWNLLSTVLVVGLLTSGCSVSGSEEGSGVYHIEVTAGEGGTVSPTEPIEAEQGEVVELLATPEEGWVFAGWEGDATATQNPLTVSISGNLKVHATFERRSYPLNLQVEGEGAVDEQVIEAPKAKEYDYETVVELTAAPAKGWEFVRWEGDLPGTHNPARLTIDNPKEVTAIFEEEAVVVKPPEYSTEADVEEAMGEVYAELRNYDYYGFTFIAMSALASDIVELAAVDGSGNLPSLDEFDHYTYGSVSPVVASFWNRSYRVLQKADTLIQYLPESSLDPVFVERKIGEASFLRGLTLFDLVRVFGGVPIFDPTNDARVTRAELFDFIISDLQYAAQKLPSFSESSAISKQAAMALLARCFLYEKQYADAMNAATDVIDSGFFALSAEYADIFRNLGSPGTIFSIELDLEDLNRQFQPVDQGGTQNLAIHASFVNTIQAQSGDMRNGMIGSYDYNSQKVYYTTKFAPIGGSIHLPILRYAEILLIYAESAAHNGNIPTALDYLNAIRARAGLTDIKEVYSENELIDAIEHERSREFFGEGHRWFDLTRTDRAMDLLQDIPLYDGSTVSINSEFRQLLPIPQSAMDRNPNLVQNAGY